MFAGSARGEAEGYRADALRPLARGVPLEVHARLPEGVRWPAEARRRLEAEIRRDWPAEQLYGPLHSSLGVWLHDPLVTAAIGGRAVIPAVEASELPIEGRLILPPEPGPKRVILLIDASSSANARMEFVASDGSRERVPVLEAEWAAVDHLLDRLGDEWLEFGVIAFGEGTWPIVPPGASVERVRHLLAEFRAEHPRGEGRTDTVCALWTAWDWLQDTPKGVGREIVLLTDGDLPHSGRFQKCGRGMSRSARERCLARFNRTACPANRHMSRGDGRSDLIQLATLGRRWKRKVRISPVVFEPDRRASAYRTLAEGSGGELVQVPSARGIEVALPSLVAGRVTGVFAHNYTADAVTADLLDGERFAGTLPLVPGANEIELRVESDRGQAALFRFRVYGVEGYLDAFLAELRERNSELADRADSLVDEARDMHRRPASRDLQIATD